MNFFLVFGSGNSDPAKIRPLKVWAPAITWKSSLFGNFHLSCGCGSQAPSPQPRLKTFKFLGVAGGTIERSCYSPHYVNTERDYERDYQATLPQGRTAADGCKPRHGRDDRKRERSFSGLSFAINFFLSIISMAFVHANSNSK